MVSIPISPHASLEGDLQIPAGAKGIVLFAHGSGSSRHSPRNKFVAQVLNQGGLATLLIVGGNDPVVIGMNEEAFSKLSCMKKMVIVAHATHLFEEKGALEQVAHLALDWFRTYLG